MKNNYSKEDYELAKSVNIVDYLYNAGYKLREKGNRIYVNEHSSLIVDKDKNVWYWFAQNMGGNTIDFLTKYEGKGIVQAVNELASNSIYERREYTRYEPIKQEKGEIKLPNRSSTNKRAWSYLTKTRGIDNDIVNELIKQGYIYENDKGGVVFVSKNKENEVKFACIRSTFPNSKFKQDVTNSNKEYGFKTVGTSERLFVFEAPIDLLTHATISKMQGKDWKKDNRVSLGGVSDKALERFLKDNEHIKEIVLFLDNDEVGLKNAKEIAKKYGNEYEIKIFTSKEKDLNETLLAYKKEKEIKKDLKFNNFVKVVDKPFIAPKINNDEIFIDYFKNLTEDILSNKVVDYFLENNLLGQTSDNKTILFIKNDNGENIGGFEFNIYNKDFKANLLKGSEEKISFFKNNDNKELIITDNPILYMSCSETHKSFDIALIEDINNLNDIENIKDLSKYNCIYPFVESKNLLEMCKDKNSIIRKNIEDISQKYSVKFKIEDFTGCLNNALKDVKVNNKKSSIKDRIKEKQAIVNSLNKRAENTQYNKLENKSITIR